MEDLGSLLSAAKARDKKAVARLITLIEGDVAIASEVLEGLGMAKEPKSHIIGFTGPAGVGKSTLISRVAEKLSREEKSVAILALDPSSPFSGGAFLGDRVRFRESSPLIYFRSMSTKEEEVIPLKALLAIEIFEALKYDYIILETPGSGQFNVRTREISDTVVVVLMPGMGDDVQALKAGLMEIGDIYVVNKSDIPGTQVTQMQVEFALRNQEREGWAPTVITTNAPQGKGVKELINMLKIREKHLKRNPAIPLGRRRNRRALEIELLILTEVSRIYKEKVEGESKETYEKALTGEANPTKAACKILKDIAAEILKNN